jgi:hypothetical protein
LEPHSFPLFLALYLVRGIQVELWALFSSYRAITRPEMVDNRQRVSGDHGRGPFTALGILVLIRACAPRTCVTE